ILSTSTSSTARYPAASGYFPFHRSSPAIAASSLGELAITSSGIFVRGFFEVDFFVPVFSAPSFFAPDFAREGATRGCSPSILRKCGGHGASPSRSFVAHCKLQQPFERARSALNLGVRIANL